MAKYNPVTAEIREKLQDIVGEKHLIYSDRDQLVPYSHDEIADPQYASLPEAVVKPASAAEIAALLKLANRELIPVTPRGAGSGLSGGAVPIRGGIVLSTERMNRILEIDKQNLVAVLEPGVITNDFNREAEKEGLFFAGYPMSREMCYIGGNVAENAGGGRAIKYGVTGRYILGMEIVLPTGDIVNLGGKRVKDVTGYNLLQLMVGSEGTLGIFTKIAVKLLPLPKCKIDMLVLFPDPATAISAVPLMINQTRSVPTGIEFMDRLSLQVSCDYLGESMKRYHEAGAILIVELDGNDADVIREEILTMGDLCLDHGALDAFIAENPSDQARFWKAREHVAEAIKALNPVQSLEDVVVPISNIPQVIEVLDELSQKHNLLIPCYGHAGDGNLHATIVKKEEVPLETWQKELPIVLEELYQAVAQLGGTISGEHGIGHKRKQFVPLVLDEAAITAMKSIKKALDPRLILNPGKLWA